MIIKLVEIYNNEVKEILINPKHIVKVEPFLYEKDITEFKKKLPLASFSIVHMSTGRSLIVVGNNSEIMNKISLSNEKSLLKG